MKLGLEPLAYASTISTYVLMIIGSYVSSSGSGNACPDWPLCNGQLVPQLSGPVLVEFTHRLFTVLVSMLVVAMTLTVWLRYRNETSIFLLTTTAFVLLMAQVFLGMVTVRSELSPPIVSAHLALASAVFGVLIVNAVAVRGIFRRQTTIFR